MLKRQNTALKGILPERVRFHTCYGINEGPRLYEAALSDIIEYVLKINAGSYSFEAANPRHEHEYHLFERTQNSRGQGAGAGHDHACQQHRRASGADRAERIVRFRRAGRAGEGSSCAAADCGFSSQALYRTEVHPTVVWEKFKLRCARAPISRQKMLWR